jgi:hypothetical protein
MFFIKAKATCCPPHWPVFSFTSGCGEGSFWRTYLIVLKAILTDITANKKYIH